MLRRPEKEKLVQELTETFKNSSLVLFTDFTGLTVAQMTKLRRSLREKMGSGAKLQVVKNTLLKMALRNAEYDVAAAEKVFFGPTAVLYVTQGDPVEAIKILHNFIKENKGTPVCKGIYLERKFFSGEQLEELSKLPSREQLLAMVVGGIQAPIRGFVNVLAGVMRNMLYVLNAIKEKKEGQ
ncbi:50S ribosomal protein L10 [Fervidobacterium thailandense]|uniref:Large ribosomal subunit protein uL10 n=1 Tax=Fervidobacterium thailandense TaxID=1008305 RepID=A0A1E3G0X2_9BACT|nr:50S ribosomal protein L10 [Fervidobacterium thailandense]ODN29877.1 50S ribosomal protein L10 [Fervidobacterium thailandense]